MMTQPEAVTPALPRVLAERRRRQIAAQRSMVTLSISPSMETSAVRGRNRVPSIA
jgi:hypothetical protein